MAVDLQPLPTTPQQNLGVFVTQCIDLATAGCSFVKGKFWEQIEKSESPTVKKGAAWFNENRDNLLLGVYGFSALVNFWTSPLTFLVLGILSFFSSISPIQSGYIGCLNERNIADISSKDSKVFAATTLAFLALANIYLGTNFFEDLFFGGIAGLLVGNCTGHRLIKTAAVQKCVQVPRLLFEVLTRLFPSLAKKEEEQVIERKTSESPTA